MKTGRLVAKPFDPRVVESDQAHLDTESLSVGTLAVGRPRTLVRSIGRGRFRLQNMNIVEAERTEKQATNGLPNCCFHVATSS